MSRTIIPDEDGPHADEFGSCELELREGQYLADLIVPLSPGASIEGTVTRSDGTPVVSAQISLRETAWKLVYSDCTSTDEYGRFVIESVPTGAFEVFAYRGIAETAPVRLVLSAGERAVIQLRFR